MRGQQSLEYLVIVATTIGIVLGGVVLYYTFSQYSAGEATGSRIQLIGSQLVSTAERTYRQGAGVRESLVVNLPGEVRRIYVDQMTGEELVIEYDTLFGTTDAVFYTDIPLNVSMPDGNVTNALHGNVQFRFDSSGTSVSVQTVG